MKHICIFVYFAVFSALICLGAPNYAHRGNTRSNFCMVIRGGIVSADIVLPEKAGRPEIEAACFLKKSLLSISSGGDVSIIVAGEKARSRIKINLIRRGVKNLFPPYDSLISFGISKNSIDISYAEGDDAWTAVGEFLGRYAGVEIFAAGELGKPFPRNRTR